MADETKDNGYRRGRIDKSLDTHKEVLEDHEEILANHDQRITRNERYRYYLEGAAAFAAFMAGSGIAVGKALGLY